MTAFILVVSPFLLLMGAVLLHAAESRRLHSNLVGLELRFPRGLEAEAAEAFLAGVTGMLLPWWRRWFLTPFIVAELVADRSGVRHRLLVPESWVEYVERLFAAHLPGVRYTRLPAHPLSTSTAAEYRLSTGQRPLAVDASAMSVRLLSELGTLDSGEAVIAQWVLAPAGPVSPARQASPRDRHQLVEPSGVVATSEEVTALRQKQARPLLLSVARIGVTASDVHRARSVLRRMEAAWHPSRAPGVQMRRRTLPTSSSVRRLGARVVPWPVWPMLTNTNELAGLLGWPIGIEQLPGLRLGGCRPLAASPEIPTTGTVIGESTYPGTGRAVALPLEARLRHLHCVAPTGTGKSTLLLQIALQDLSAGHGLVIIDPKGDLVTDVLARMPESRRGDVIVLDPADDERPVGLNPLTVSDGVSSEVVVENLVGTLRTLYASNWGPRSDDILRAALMTLVGRRNATLCELPLLLTDAALRRRLVGMLDDPVGVESFWGWYDGLSRNEQSSVIAPVLNKVRAFVMRPRVRGIVGQGQPKLSMSDVLAEGKVLLVSLASGLLGEEASRLLGALVVAELWHATTARARIPSEQRTPVMALIDEWQHIVALPTPMAQVLAEARGFGLGLTLAHQHLTQLDRETREAVLANARSRVVFQLPATDAKLLVPHLGSGLRAEELSDLDAYEAVAQVFAAGRTQPSCTIATAPAPPASGDAAELREQSRQRYGVDAAEVEAVIRQRRQAGNTNAPVGRRRRPRGSS